MMKFQEIAPNDFIIFREDDLQVCTQIMWGINLIKRSATELDSSPFILIGNKMVDEGMNGMRNRDILIDVSKMSKFNAHYIEIFKNDPEKLAFFCYNQIMNFWADPKTQNFT